MERTWAKATDELIAKALEEDLGKGDITTKAIVSSRLQSTAYLFNKEQGVLAGIDVAKKVFTAVDHRLTFNGCCKDGEEVKNGQKIFEITGSVASILKAERTALNFLGRMTGIATKTAAFVKKTEGHHAKILDTRKTIPTMRHLDKYSVRTGGGSNHRFGLFDMVLIKDNHIAVAGGIRIAVDKVMTSLSKDAREKIKIEVECKSLDEVLEAIYTPVDIIMLDNMDLPDVENSVKTIHEANDENGRSIRVEVSGNVDLDNISSLSKIGVDYISVGALTHSVMNHDFTLLFNEL